MKVYVRELPKSCYECPYCEGILVDAGMNKLSFCKAKKYKMLKDKKLDKTFDKCLVKDEFQSLSDYTKQVRKEVCEEIQAKIEEKARYSTNNNDGWDILIDENLFLEILDQIQGESNE